VPRTVASDRDLVDAVLAALQEAGESAGFAVHDGESPAGAVAPHVIVFSLSSAGPTGPIGDPHADEDMVVQTTSVGVSRAQAQWVGDHVKVRLLAGRLEIPGRTLTGPVRMDVANGVRRDDDTAGPPVFYATARWRFPTTPLRTPQEEPTA
jgi:hypothetical protein